MIRLQRGNAIDAAPIFMPEDAAIPAPEVSAPPRFTRTFVPDSQVLQREQKGSASDALTGFAYSVVAAIALALLALLAWGLHRLAVTAPRLSDPPAARRAVATGDGPPPDPAIAAR